jgi:hypothetical protein
VGAAATGLEDAILLHQLSHAEVRDLDVLVRIQQTGKPDRGIKHAKRRSVFATEQLECQ